MSRAQVIVTRGLRILLVHHRETKPGHPPESSTESYWCLPGGAPLPHETPEQAALRELQEECHVTGTLLAPTAVTTYGPNDHHYTFHVDIGQQEPSLGHDPELTPTTQILTAVAFLTLAEIPPLQRIYLWSAGLLTLPGFYEEAQRLENPR